MIISNDHYYTICWRKSFSWEALTVISSLQSTPQDIVKQVSTLAENLIAFAMPSDVYLLRWKGGKKLKEKEEWGIFRYSRKLNDLFSDI